MIRLGCWIGLLAAAVLALAKAGRGPLRTPPLGGGLVHWAAGSPPQLVLFSLLRMAALGLGTYLLAAAVLSVVASITRWRPIISLSDVLSPAFLRAVISVAVTSTALSPGVAGATPGPDSTSARSAGDPAPTMVLVDPAPAPPASQPTTWVVRRGDNFWFVATQVEANPAKVAAYWTRLVADNQTRLRFPTNPSLIYAGQRLDLPPR